MPTAYHGGRPHGPRQAPRKAPRQYPWRYSRPAPRQSPRQAPWKYHHTLKADHSPDACPFALALGQDVFFRGCRHCHSQGFDDRYELSCLGIYIYIYIQSFAAPKSEAFASDSVLNLIWDSRRLRFLGFVLGFSTAFLEGRARRALTGAPPCARLGVSRHRRARRPRSRRIFAGARRLTEVLFSSVLEICLAVVAPRRACFFYDRLDLPQLTLKILLLQARS